MLRIAKIKQKMSGFNILYTEFVRSMLVNLILIFAVILSSTITITYTSFVNELRKDIWDSKVKQLHVLERTISNRMAELYSISYHISNDRKFTFIPLSSSMYEGYQLSQALDNLLVGNDYISHLVYYRISEPEKFYTSSGEMSVRSFWNGFVGFKGETEEGFIQAIQNSSERIVLPMKESIKGTRYMTLIFPIPQISNKPSAYVLAYISETSINNSVDALFTDCQGLFLLLDSSGNPIYEYSTLESEIAQEEVKAYADRIPDDSSYREFRMGKEKYLILKSTSEYNKWQYITLIPMNDIMHGLYKRQVTFVIILLSVLISAIIAVIISMQIKYSPISKLAETISKDFLLKYNSPKKMNEQVIISQAFETLRVQMENINERLFLSNLLANQYDEDTIAFVLDEYGIHFEYSHYIAIIIYFPNISQRELDNRVMNYIDQHLEIDDMQCYILSRKKPGHIFMLVNADEILSAVEDICIAIANQRKETQSSKNNELLDAIKNYIMEHLCDSMLSLDSIAEGCGISSSYLSRFFKANMGCTTMQYVESLRMDMVKDKLRNTDDPLKKILTETGYVDQSGFIRRFKQLEGMTPISYRKSYREMA